VRAMADLWAHTGCFRGGTEELTPLAGDLRALVPLALVGGALTVSPRAWKALSSSAVNAYAATPLVVDFVRS